MLTNSCVGLYLLYKEFTFLLAGVQRNIVIMKEGFTLLMATNSYYFKLKVKALIGKKSIPSMTLTGAQFTHIAHRKLRGSGSSSETQLCSLS